jgi:hypothetical protein
MTAVGTISPSACSACRFRHSGNSLAAAFSVEDRELAPGVLPPAQRARDGRVRLAHRADGFKYLLAFLTDIFINWHSHLNIKEDFPARVSLTGVIREELTLLF